MARMFVDDEVIPGFEPGVWYVAGPQTDASAAHLVCCYDDVALPIEDIQHGWAKSQPVLDEAGDLWRSGAFTWHRTRPRGGWPCTQVLVAPGADDLPRYTHCVHREEGGHQRATHPYTPDPWQMLYSLVSA